MIRRIFVFLAALVLCASSASAAVSFSEKISVGLEGKTIVRFSGDNDTVLRIDGEEYRPISGKRFDLRGLKAQERPYRMELIRNGAAADKALLFVDTDKHTQIVRVDTGEKLIAITFDSANGEGKIDALLDLLKKYGAKGTFFLCGSYIKNFPDHTKRIAEEGHELANHSTNHPEMAKADNGKIWAELTETNELISSTTGQVCRLYRAPSGLGTYRDRAIARGLGMENIFWSADTMDGWLDTPLRTMHSKLFGNTEPGGIFLLHIYGTYTLQALDEYIPYAQGLGYRFVTVSELLASGELIDQGGNRYPARQLTDTDRNE